MSKGKENKEKEKDHGAVAETGTASGLEEQMEEEEEEEKEGEKEIEKGGLEFGVGEISAAEEKELGTELEEILKSCGRAQSKPKLLTVESGDKTCW